LNGKGVYLDELFAPYEPMTLLQEYGGVTDEEAYEVWNMGIGMVLVSNDFEKIQKSLMEDGIRAQVMGEITESGEVVFKSQGAFKKGVELRI
jgi:phosphoribosylaminoimidazole (AIR) synthetase